MIAMRGLCTCRSPGCSLDLKQLAVACAMLVAVAYPRPAGAQQIILTGDVFATIDPNTTTPPSPWDVGDDLIVGDDQAGFLVIGGGGVVVHSVTNPGIGRTTTHIGSQFFNGQGNVLVSGQGSLLNYGNEMRVGDGGAGFLTIEQGARAISSGPDIFGAVAATGIGISGGAFGTVRVDGAGSFWDAGERLSVGLEGTGSLAITNGGSVATNTVAIIGRVTNGVGSERIDGAGSSFNSGSLIFVGLGGIGSMEVTNGGSLLSGGTIDIGGGAGLPAMDILPGDGTGSVMLSGSGSAISAGSSITVGNSGVGTLTIANGASAVSPTVNVALQPGSSGILNINGGSLQTDSIVFGGGAGTLNIATPATFALTARMSGAGTFNVLSGNVVQSADSSAFAGNTNVVGGSLSVNGILGGVIAVQNGGLLGGTGTVGSTSVAGVLSPGNSIGTINVSGDLTFDRGSTYRVELDPAGNADRTMVSGTATLNGGLVDVVASAGRWRIRTDYIILTAAHGLQTQFLGASSDLQFLEPILGYDADNVILTMRRNDVDFADIARTPNQRRATASIDAFVAASAFPDDNALVSELLGLDTATAPLTISQLPGEIHASLKSILLDDSHFIADTANGRLRAALGGVAAPMIPVMAYGPDGVVPEPATADNFAVWGQGFGSWADWNSDDQVPGLDRSLGGILLGADIPLAADTRLGLLAGYSHSDIDEDDGASADVDNIHLGVYGGAAFGALQLRSGASYTWHEVATDRSVQFSTSQQHLSADYDGGTAQVFGEVGYTVHATSMSFEPFANISYANLHLDSFAEEGGSAALRAKSSNENVAFSTFGLRASKQLSLGHTEVDWRGAVGWRHAYGDVSPTSQVAFAGLGTFDVVGLPIARDAAVIETGFDIHLGHATTFGLSYRGQIAAEAQDHGFRADLTARF